MDLYIFHVFVFVLTWDRRRYRSEDDPVTLAVFHFGREVCCQVVFIDVSQQVTD